MMMSCCGPATEAERHYSPWVLEADESLDSRPPSMGWTGVSERGVVPKDSRGGGERVMPVCPNTDGLAMM